MGIDVIKIFFIKFLLLPLIALLFIAVMVFIKKKNKLIANKILIVYILIGILIIALPGLLGFAGNSFNPYWYLIAQLYYLGLGIWNVTLLQKFLADADAKPIHSMLLEILVTLICMLLGAYLFVFVFDWFSPFDGYAVVSSTSIAVFALPLIFYYCYVQFISIPFDIYKTWEHNNFNADFQDDFAGRDFNKLMVINIELSKNLADGNRFRVKAKAPDTMIFGKWFARFIEDYNTRYPQSRIQVYDETDTACSWIFYTKKSIFHFRRYIDFDQTVSDNKITDKDNIVCKRVLNHFQTQPPDEAALYE